MHNFLKFLIPIVVCLLGYQVGKHADSIKRLDFMKMPKVIQLNFLDQRIAHWIGLSKSADVFDKYEYIAKTGSERVSQLQRVRAKLLALPDHTNEENLAQIKLESDAIEEDLSDFFNIFLSFELTKHVSLSVAAYQLTFGNPQLPKAGEIVDRVMDILNLEELYTVTDDHKQREISEQLAGLYKTLQEESHSWIVILNKNIFSRSPYEPICPGGKLGRRPETGSRGDQEIRERRQKLEESGRQITKPFPVDSTAMVPEALNAFQTFYNNSIHLRNIICSDVA